MEDSMEKKKSSSRKLTLIVHYYLSSLDWSSRQFAEGYSWSLVD
jgi:hypothetical protein